MKYRVHLKLSIILIGVCCNSAAQEKKLSGKIIDQHLNPLPWVLIQTLDSTYYTNTNENGLYSLNLPEKTKKVKIKCIGMETEVIKINNYCHFDIILLDDIIVEFETNNQHIKSYKKRKKELPKLYKESIKKGILLGKRKCR